MLVARRRGLTIVEVWFGEPMDRVRADIVRYHQAPQPIPGATCTPFYTLVLDLTQTREDLWSAIDKSTRYKIRRAEERDAVTCTAWDGVEASLLARFRSTYDEFARLKGLAPLPWPYVGQLLEAGMLDVSLASAGGSGDLVYHAHLVVAGQRARLLYSASLFRASEDTAFRNLVGRANRLLHWQDILRFKERGIAAYDFGGWYEGHADEELLRINAFKEAFGGRPEKGYNAEALLTAKARLFASIAVGLGLRRRASSANVGRGASP